MSSVRSFTAGKITGRIYCQHIFRHPSYYFPKPWEQCDGCGKNVTYNTEKLSWDVIPNITEELKRNLKKCDV
jgi:hypothetical protein